MGTFGGSLWGGGAGQVAPVVPGVQLLAGILYPAFRIAGITDRPGRTPSTDQINDAIPMLNRMLGSWSIQPLDIFTTSIASYPLTGNKVSYTIGGPGAGADFNAVRPNKIKQAVIILNTSNPPVRLPPMYIMTDEDWANVALQTVPNTIPLAIYPDGNYPLETLYLWGQSASGLLLELYTWQAIPRFQNTGDVVSMPDGYELAITYNLARLLAEGFPSQSKMAASSYITARDSLAAIQSLNAVTPNRMVSDAPNPRGTSGGAHFDWRIGLNR